MSEPVQSPTPAAGRRRSTSRRCAEWLEQRRWYASKSRHVTAAEIEDAIALAERAAARDRARCRRGLRPAPTSSTSCRSRSSSAPTSMPTASIGESHSGAGVGAIDAVADPELRARAAAPHRRPVTRSRPTTARCASTASTGVRLADGGRPVRPIGVEQSNSSIVFDDETVLKVFRKLEPGINPELEMLRFLTAHGFRASRRCRAGTSTRAGRSPRRSASPSAFFPDARDGWELALDQIAQRPASCCWPSSGASAR